MKVLLAVALLIAADDRVDRLSDVHKEWLEKEVVYIIAGEEREAFLQLQSEEERQSFIAAFWQRRDPDPVTPVNEFREEHARRYEHVNRYFSRESAMPGWMTDRGKIYMILGEPDDREDFTSVPMLYPTEVWFYQQDREKALPPLNFLFFQEHSVGPYRMFNHFLDEPTDLMPAQPMNPEEARMEAYVLLQEMSPSLAHAAYTLRADQGVMTNIAQPDRASLDFQSLLSDIYVSPHRRVDTRYVDAVDEARGLVESEFLFNYVPNRGMANILPGPGGARFAHYSIEIAAQDMTLAYDPDKKSYYTSFELKGEVTTPDGATIVHRFTKEPYVQLTQAQFREVGSRAFVYRDMFPIAPGEFSFRLVMKNRARSEYTLFESELVVSDSRRLETWLGVPVPLYGFARSDAEESAHTYHPYQIGAVRMDPNAKRTVAIGDFLMTHVPVENAPEGSRLTTGIYARGADRTLGSEPVRTEVHRLDFYERPIVLRTPTEGLSSGRFRLVVELASPDGDVQATRFVDFDISPLSRLDRAWGIRESVDGADVGVVHAVLAEQALRLGRDEEGRRLAKEAVEADPNLVAARLLLARFHLDAGEYRDAIRLLEPARAQQPRNVEILLALGDAHFNAGGYERAATLFEDAAEVRRPDSTLLNALGLAYARLGKQESALEYLNRSLTLNADQPQIQELVTELSQSPAR